MRKVLALVALSAACDGKTDITPMADGSVDMEVPPDAPPSIDGTWRDTFHTVNGATTMSTCNAAPSAIKVDPTTAVVTPYTGTCKPDGSFQIDAPGNLGSYYLRVQSSLYESSKRSDIDLSTDRLGRNDVAAIVGVTLGLTMTGMQSWTSGDLLVAFGANIGYRQNLTFTSGAPSTGETTLAGTANWSGYKIDGSKSDALQILQLGKHTSNGLDYVSLDRMFEVPSFTMVNNTEHEIAGAFTTTPSSSLPLSINVASFNQFASSAAPSVTQKSIQGSAYAAVSTDVIESPPLLSFAQIVDGVTVMNFGTLTYGDPFPSSWKRMFKVQVGYTVPYTWNSQTGTLNALVVRVMTKATAEAGIIDARIGPPTSVMFDGENALTDTSISPVPVVSWSPPTFGTPTDYEVQVYEAKSGTSGLTFSSVLRILTKETSVRIPAGYLHGQRQYVFVVRARSREGVDVHGTPLRAGAQWSSADTLSALVTTAS